MRKTLFVVALALILTFAFAAGAFATTGKFYKGGVDYYKWTAPTGSPAPGTSWVASGMSGVASNTVLPGAHAGYLATTAKCGICHSVHRAAGSGEKLLPTADTSCAGCHTGSTAITAKIITVGVVNMNWRKGDSTASAFSFGGAGPHNDALDTMYADGEWDGVSTPPSPSFSTNPFERYGCSTRRCHATNPHGANSSKYKIFAQKLLFNNTVAQDDEEYAAEHPEVSPAKEGTYGGEDAVYDALGATDASVKRFADNNSADGLITLSGDQILIHGVAPDANETHALVAGLTCGRPSNPGTGEDECHSEAAYAIVDKAIKENRNHATGLTKAGSGAPVRDGGYTTDNTGAEYEGWGGNDNRDSKTGHVAGTFAAQNTEGSYTAIAGCTSCHDQTDTNNTVAGNYTFPHGQTPTGNTNAVTATGGSATMVRSRIWSGYAANAGDQKTVTNTADLANNQAGAKAFDGQCLKCHRDSAGTAGIGLTK
ncbi:MAG: cytochrome c3 family protein [Actinomycetes bacterium]